jgi:hypothetical protein
MKRTLKLLDSLIPRKLVTENNLGRMKTHRQEVLCLAEKLSGEDEDEVGAVTHLRKARTSVKCALPRRRTEREEETLNPAQETTENANSPRAPAADSP